MGKKMLCALVLIGLCALVLVINTRSSLLEREVSIDLLVTTVKMLKSLAFLLFTATGVAIGVLLHK